MAADDIRLVYVSGDCEIDLARRELRVLGSPMPLGGRAFQIVEALVQSAGEIVTKDELMTRLWPGAIVMDGTLHVHAGAIRKALGPFRSLLKTESRRGYRLLGDWTVRRHDAARPPIGFQRMRLADEAPVTNFPATVTPLIGRSAAAALLRDLTSAYRVVTLTGPGGIGKTSLALQLARGVAGEFADGGWLVELASLSDPSLVPAAVAGGLMLGLRSGNVTREAVARAIWDRKLLLLLDNCEHLIGAVANLVETLLAFCPNVTIVTTSREVLGIHGEYVYRVPPLDVPAIDRVQSAEILGHSAADLFVTRAREFGADLLSNPSSAPMIAAICRHLDGIPLAIEFAAARAARLGVKRVASGLRDRFSLLTNGRRTALPRHRTLRATLDWSYQLLTEAERDLLNRLAIFAGPFSLDAACAVAAEGTSDAAIADSIADLVGKSLVIRATDPVTAEFRLLETTRMYAIDRLTESGALNQAARLHARHFLTTLATLDAERRSKPPNEYLVAFRRCAEEVHVALEWAFSPTGDAATALALTIAAVPLWFELTQMTVLGNRVEQALPHARTGSDTEMRLCIALGHSLWYRNPDDDALEPTFGRALDIAERIGATGPRTQALWGIWAARRGRGDNSAALEMAHRYAAAAASVGDTGAMHLGDRILGLTHHVLGHQPTAREFAERALRHPHPLNPASSIGYQAETPIAIGALLARVLWLQGFPDQAAEASAAAVAEGIATAQLFPQWYALVYAGLPVALWNGAMDEARRRMDSLVALGATSQRAEQWLFCFARLLKLRDGNEDEALIASFIEPRLDVVGVPPFSDRAPDADIRVPLPGAEPVDALWNAPELLRVDAELLVWHDAPGAIQAAEAKLLRALELARGQSALSWELRVAMNLARLWWRLGRVTEARNLVAATYGKFTEGFGTSDLMRARNMIADLESGGS